MILLTNDPRNTDVVVPIEGVVRAQIALSPDSLFMGVVEPGQKVTRQLMLRGREAISSD